VRVWASRGRGARRLSPAFPPYCLPLPASCALRSTDASRFTVSTCFRPCVRYENGTVYACVVGVAVAAGPHRVLSSLLTPEPEPALKSDVTTAPLALIIEPTRELAQQTATVLEELQAHTTVRTVRSLSAPFGFGVRLPAVPWCWSACAQKVG
jgi:hypothetical protein